MSTETRICVVVICIAMLLSAHAFNRRIATLERQMAELVPP